MIFLEETRPYKTGEFQSPNGSIHTIAAKGKNSGKDDKHGHHGCEILIAANKQRAKDEEGKPFTISHYCISTIYESPVILIASIKCAAIKPIFVSAHVPQIAN